MANQNTNDIVNAYNKHLGMIKTIQNKQEEITKLHNLMFNHIKEINEIYTLVFKNIYPDKKKIVDIDAKKDRYSYRFNDGDIIKMRVFLNRDGFSFSNNFKIGDEPEERSNYLQSLDPKEFLKTLVMLFSIKDEICNALVREYKKSIAIRFFESLEKSNFNNIINQNEDFDDFKITLPVKKSIYFYDDLEMKKIDVTMFEDNGASTYIKVDKDTSNSWGGRETQVRLDDLEKLSQIYDEMMDFLQKYYAYLDKQDKVLVSFYALLKDAFARELIINSLKDAPQKEN